MSNIFYTLRNVVRSYSSGSNLLIIATVLALIAANLPATAELYNGLWQIPIGLQIGDFNLFSHNGHPMNLGAFVNDALMAIFFFSVGLEIKREMLIGELASVRQALLPVIAACGGMIFPVLVFYFIGLEEGGDILRGCAIPMATDIAFSLGVLSMLGKRVPIALTVFLTTLAVADDIGGIIVIAVFYSETPNLLLLGIAALVVAGLLLANKLGIRSKAFYILVGLVVWYLFVNSGIHPTIAGVVIAFTIPTNPLVAPKRFLRTIRDRVERFPVISDEDLETKTMLSREQLDWLNEVQALSNKMLSPAQSLENRLQRVVNYFILPLFAFANAGIYIADMPISAAYSGVALAIIGGLVIGKFVGIFSFTWIAVMLGMSPKPSRSTWPMIASVSMLGGIGFTVSLFIATLSFPGSNPAMATLLNDAKLGIILGSIISGFLGYMMLNLTLPKEGELEADNDAISGAAPQAATPATSDTAAPVADGNATPPAAANPSEAAPKADTAQSSI